MVDDGSDDDTFEVISRLAARDDRVRAFRIDHGGVAAARNYTLDRARGDAIVYLDDDNRFDPDWLHAVVWAFTADECRRVLYGARVVDDVDRHHGRSAGGRPWLQFLEWDRRAVEEFNRVDMNVLAHRPSPARFDTLIDYFADWDLVLKLTDETEPFELPVVATYYTTDHAHASHVEHQRRDDRPAVRAGPREHRAPPARPVTGRASRRLMQAGRAPGAPKAAARARRVHDRARPAKLLEISRPTLEKFADGNDYELVTVEHRLAPDRPTSWGKVVLLHQLVQQYDLVLWVDADALFVDPTRDLEAELRPGRFLHLAAHQIGCERIYNCGVMALRGGLRSRRFLERVWNQHDLVHHDWWRTRQCCGCSDTASNTRCAPSGCLRGWRASVGSTSRGTASPTARRPTR